MWEFVPIVKQTLIGVLGHIAAAKKQELREHKSSHGTVIKTTFADWLRNGGSRLYAHIKDIIVISSSLQYFLDTTI